MDNDFRFVVGFGLAYLVNGQFELQCNFSTEERRDFYIHHKLSDLERMSMVKFLFTRGNRQTLIELER